MYVGLWFDVERRYKTMAASGQCASFQLWFDVERRYKTMMKISVLWLYRCGLM